jgi:hypothetical protein
MVFKKMVPDMPVTMITLTGHGTEMAAREGLDRGLRLSHETLRSGGTGG